MALTVSVSGASNYVQDSTTATNVTINAGYANPDSCASKDNVNTCNSCVGTTVTRNGKAVPAPCNDKSIYGSLVLTISVSSDKTDINGLTVGASKTSDYSEGAISTITTTTVDGRSYSISMTWDTLVTALSSVSSGSGIFNITDCTTTCGGTRTLYFGPVKESEFVEKIAVTINLSFVKNGQNSDTRAVASVCPPRDNELVSDTSSIGFCYYEMIPGDEKAYISNFIPAWKSSPKDPDTGIEYNQLVMFYREKDPALSALDNIASIQNNFSNATLAINNSETDPLADNKITGLENSDENGDRTYCFLSALKDKTGNIQYFLDVQNSKGDTYTKDATQMEEMYNTYFCASPSEVMGVLGDKSCFVATATFGSSLHPFINILRQFRDQKLLKTNWGKSFVKWYYQNGPIGAHWIEKNSYIKPVVRVLLLPLIGVAYLALNYSEVGKFVLLFVLGICIVFFKRMTPLHKKIPVIFISMLIGGLLSGPRVQAQVDEFMEEPIAAPTTSETPTNFDLPTGADAPPEEPPYTKTKDQVEAEKLNDIPNNIPVEATPPAKNTPAVTNIPPSDNTNPNVNSQFSATPDSYKISHPDAQKGLYLIDQNTGKYYYKITKEAKKNQTTSIRIGMIDPPDIEAERTVGAPFTFSQMYGEDQIPYLMLDYEWQPFTRFGKLGFNLGMGLFTASGNGRYKTENTYPEAMESYTFIGLPISLGGLYRFEYGHRQWLAPFINAGVSYYLLAEIRDDGKRPAFLGTPAAYGGGGVMFNITAWDNEIAFNMDREYGISNMWITAEYKIIKSLNEDIDMSANFFNMGISVDY